MGHTNRKTRSQYEKALGLLFEPSIDKGSKNLTNYKQRPNRELRNVQNAEKRKTQRKYLGRQMAVLKSLFLVIPCEACGLQCTV